MKILTTSILLLGAAIAGAFMPATLTRAQKAPTLADDEIASVTVVANQNDIDFANIALKKSTEPAILDFAKTMQRDHQAVTDQAVALVTKLKVTPKDNALS